MSKLGTKRRATGGSRGKEKLVRDLGRFTKCKQCGCVLLTLNLAKHRKKCPSRSKKKRRRTLFKADVLEFEPNTYAERDRVVRSMGLEDYEGYLASSIWMVIRQRVIERDESTCRICKKPGTTGHHIDYSLKSLLGWCLEGIVTLCEDCHREVEFDGKAKRSFREVKEVTAALLRR